MFGYVRARTDYGVFVGFPHGLSALAPIPLLSDGFVSNPAAMFEMGQTVRAKVWIRSNFRWDLEVRIWPCHPSSKKRKTGGQIAVTDGKPYMQHPAANRENGLGKRFELWRKPAKYY